MANTDKNCGFILINKASGPSSHDVINSLRRLTCIKKIGHAGTLDPLASGLLICAVGRDATKRIDLFVKQDKVYEAEAILGATSDTYDSQGVIIDNGQQAVDKESILTALSKFTGPQQQIPPMYSAKKVKGQKLYELARQGIEIERQPCSIVIKRLELVNYDWPKLNIIIECSSGTYIRSLIDDLGRELGVGAYMSALIRTAIGNFNLSQAVALTTLTKDNWQNFLLPSDSSL